MLRTRIACLAALLIVSVVLPASADAQRRGGRLGGALRNAVGAPEITETQLIPSGIDAGFSAYDEENPLVAAEVQATSVGIDNYDSFFSELANVEGTLTLAQYTLDRANALLDGGLTDQVFSGTLFTDALGTAVDVPVESRQGLVMAVISGNFAGAQASGVNMTQDQFETVRTGFFDAYPDTLILRDTVPASVQALTVLPERVAGLSSTAPTLVTEAPNTFAGPNAANLPRVTRELGQATDDIAAMPGTIADIASGFASLMSANQ